MESNPFLRQAEEAANGAPAHASASGTPSAEELTQIVRSEVDAMHEADVQQRAKELLNGSAFTVGEIDKSLARMPLVVQLARKSYEQKPEDLMRFSNVLRNQALLERAKGVLQAQQASNDEPAAKPSAPGTSPWDRPKIRPGTNLDFVELNNPANAPQTDFGKQVNRGASTKGFGKGAGSRGAQLMQSAQKANPATQGNANRKLSTAAKTKPAPLMGLGGNGWNRSPCGFCGDMCNARDLQTVEVSLCGAWHRLQWGEAPSRGLWLFGLMECLMGRQGATIGRDLAACNSAGSESSTRIRG